MASREHTSRVRAAQPNPTWTCTSAQLGRILVGVCGLPTHHASLLAVKAQESGPTGEITFSTEIHLLDGPLSHKETAGLATRHEWLVRRIHEIGRDYRIIRTNRTAVPR